MTAQDALTLAFVIPVAGAVLSGIASRARTLAGAIAFAATAASGGLVLFVAGRVLLGTPAEPFTLLEWPALGSSLRIHVDGLSALFLVLIAGIAILASFYSIGYMRHYKDLGVGRYYPHFLLFVAGMYGIVTLTDLMGFFFLFWQLMTIPSFFLVRFEHRKAENVRAATRYLIMMEISCLLVMAAAWILGGQNGSAAGGLATYDFERIAEGMPELLRSHGGLVSLALLLFLAGFGIKAGMWPFGQLWLPDAHPAAPSPVSALLSGVMIKTGIYGLARSFLWLVPASALDSFPAKPWGFVIALLGTITLLVGTLQALKQEETKRLLAFHSIGQVGYIILGLGTALVLLPAGPAPAGLASLALFGALFHTINHGLFKSLLFFDAGSMLYATGTQDLNRLGGLMRFMPLTATTTLIASFSIAGVPLFNGFASKWSIYVAAITGAKGAGYLPLFGIFAILTSALTLASFMKFFGASCLSPTSRLVEEKAREKNLEKGRLEVGWILQAPQVILAALCILLGIFPIWAYKLIQAALEGSAQGFGGILAAAQVPAAGGLAGIPASGGKAILGPLVFAAVLVVLILLARAISRVGTSSRRIDGPWLCGYARQAEIHRYGAHNMYTEVKRYFAWVGGVRKNGTHAGAGAPAAKASKGEARR